MTEQLLFAKSVIRKNTLALREQIPVESRVESSVNIIGHLLKLAAYQQANAVLGYMNFGSEFNSELWVSRALTEGKRLALPRMNRHTNRLDLYWVDDLENQLTQGLWGIREPIVERCERMETLNEVEFVLLPGVAFNKNGSRLGYGGGYYDKLLAGLPHQPDLVAAAFELQVVEHIPQEATDVKVHWLITEQKTIHCSEDANIN